MSSATSLFSVIDRETRGFFQKSFSRFGVTGDAVPVLLAIFDEEGINQLELIEKLHMEKGVVVRAIEKLVQLRFVEKRKQWHDARVSNLYPTELGLNIKKEFDLIVEDWENVIFKGFRMEDREPLCRLLKKIKENVLATSAT